MFAPWLSYFNCSIPTASTIMAGLQNSGFLYFQDPGITTVPMDSLLGATNGVYPMTSTASATTTYGYASGSSSSYFTGVYAGKVKISIVSPLANLTGTYFKIRLPFRSLTNGAFSINTMLPFAYETGVSVSSYELQSSISSDAIFGFITGNIASSTTSSFPYYMEYVEILVLQNPVISITGANMTYSVVVEFKNNNYSSKNVRHTHLQSS